MWQEPNCDFSDLDIYKDWLYEFNNNDDLRGIDFACLACGGYYGYSVLKGCHFGFLGEEEFGLGEGVIGEVDRLDYEMNMFSPAWEDYYLEETTHYANCSFGDGFFMTQGLIQLDIEGMDTEHGDGYYD